ncbi:hypothetical protein PO909_018362 [Leuciscus waleckii]
MFVEWVLVNNALAFTICPVEDITSPTLDPKPSQPSPRCTEISTSNSLGSTWDQHPHGSTRLPCTSGPALVRHHSACATDLRALCYASSLGSISVHRAPGVNSQISTMAPSSLDSAGSHRPGCALGSCLTINVPGSSQNHRCPDLSFCHLLWCPALRLPSSSYKAAPS